MTSFDATLADIRRTLQNALQSEKSSDLYHAFDTFDETAERLYAAVANLNDEERSKLLTAVADLMNAAFTAGHSGTISPSTYRRIRSAAASQARQALTTPEREATIDAVLKQFTDGWNGVAPNRTYLSKNIEDELKRRGFPLGEKAVRSRLAKAGYAKPRTGTPIRSPKKKKGV